MTLDDYLNAALARTGSRSDRALANRLNINHASISQFRTHRAWPSDETMLTLANLAGIDPEIALLDLNTWRSKSEPARELYSALARRLASTVSALAFIVVASGTTGEHLSFNCSKSIHYAMYRRRKRLTDWLTGWRRAVSRYRARALSPRAAT